MSLMLSVTFKTYVLSVIMLTVVMLSVVAANPPPPPKHVVIFITAVISFVRHTLVLYDLTVVIVATLY